MARIGTTTRLKSQNATVEGTSARSVGGSGNLPSQRASVFAVGDAVRTGLGSLQSQNPVASGSGIVTTSGFPATLRTEGVATPEQIAIVVSDLNGLAQNFTATVRYRQSGGGAWTEGHPLFRVQPGASTFPFIGGAVEDVFAWPLIDLVPGLSYEVEVTLTNQLVSYVDSITVSTKALPSAAPPVTSTISAGATSAQIQAAFNALGGANNHLRIEAGDYDVNNLTLSVNGPSETNPIYISGESRDTTTLRNLSNAYIIELFNVSNVVIENLGFRGWGIDADPNVESINSVAFIQQDSFSATNLTIRNCRMFGIHKCVDIWSGAEGVLVYDNHIVGTNDWTVAFLETNRTWDDAGIKLPGNGNCAFQNYIEGFGDTFSYASHSGSSNASGPDNNIHFYRNYIRNSCDDPVEVDHARRNCTFYDNIGVNVINASSIDPLYGGPYVHARNIMVNPYRVNLHKWNDQNTGQFFYNNTVVSTVSRGSDADVSNWYQPSNGNQEYYGYRNNIVIYRGNGQSIWLESGGHNNLDWTHNSWFPDRAIQWDFSSYANLATAQAQLASTTPIFSGAQRMVNDLIENSNNPFVSTISLGADSLTELASTFTAADFALLPTAASKNSGVAIPNITDGFSGGAPDRGAIIAGRVLPVYGDQTPDTTAPNYIAALSDYQVIQLTGVYAPSNGNETMVDITPNEWLNSDPGNTDLPGVIEAWCGGYKGEGTVLWVQGGGHFDSANNGMYSYEFAGTDVPTGWQAPLDVSTIGDVLQGDAYADGAASSIHGYDGTVRHPTNGNLYRFGGAPWNGNGGFTGGSWRYNPQTQVWTVLPRVAGIGFPAGTGIPICGVDPLSGKIFAAVPTALSGYILDPVDNSTVNVNISSYAGSDNVNNEPTFAFDKKRSRGIVVSASVTDLYDIDFVNNTLSRSSFTASGATQILGSAKCIIYDEDRDVYWLFGGRSGEPGFTSIFEMNASTFAITQRSLTGSISTRGGAQGSYGRWVFMREFDAIGFVGHHDQAPHVIKLPAPTDTNYRTGGIQFNENLTGSSNADYARLTTLPPGFGDGEYTLEMVLDPRLILNLGTTIGGQEQLQNWTTQTGEPGASNDWWWKGNFLLDGHNNNLGFSEGTFSLQFYNSGNLRWLVGDGAPELGSYLGNLHGIQNTGGVNLLDGQKHYVSLVRRFTPGNTATYELWIDGVLQDSVQSSVRTNMATAYWDNWTGMSAAQAGWFFGAEKQVPVGINSQYEDYKGIIRSLSFFNGAKSAVELAANFRNAVDTAHQFYADHFPFNEGSGNTATSANGLQLSLLQGNSFWVGE